MKNVHLGLNCTSLENSLAFYTKLFGVQPVKVKPDYAKFQVDAVRLLFTLNAAADVQGNQVNHFGFQVDRQEDLASHRRRLIEAGLSIAAEEADTTCCYAVQDKFWVVDPDGNEWEFFYTKEDADVHSLKARTCC